MPEASIIIRTFNEAKHLPGLLDGLERQSFRDFETIVVDSGSTDSTREIAQAHDTRLLRIEKHDFTFGYSLNVGIKAAEGRFAVLVSAHTAPVSDDWLERLIAPFGDETVAMTYGRQFGVQASKFSENEDFRRIFSAESTDMTTFFANNANSAIRRDLWDAYRFDETLTGLEDIDWAKHWMERGYRVRYVADAGIYHIHEETWEQVERRYFREAVAARHIGVRGRADVAGEILREIAWTGADLIRAAASDANPSAARLGRGGRAREILAFRARKLRGTVAGLMQDHALETREEQEHYYFDREARAVRIHRPHHAQLETVALDDLKPGEVRIRVAHVGVCAADIALADGRLGDAASGPGRYPIVPGQEFSGRIVEVGANVDGLKPGDPAVVETVQTCGGCAPCLAANPAGCENRAELGVSRRDGAYGDFVTTPARFVHALPADLDLRKAALIAPVAAVLKGWRRLSPLVSARPDALRCAVVGAGPLGNMCAKVLAKKGVSVVAIDGKKTRRAALERSGIATSADIADAARADAVIDLSGDPEAVGRALRQLRPGVPVLLLGRSYAGGPFSFESIAAFDRVVIGSAGAETEDFRAAIALIGDLDLDDLLASRFPLEAFETAWAALRDETILKAIIDVAPGEPTAAAS